MTKVKELYRSKLHKRDKSHDVCIVQDNINVNGSKLKMTYECYNGVDRFTGERFVSGKWEHNFSMLDLGVLSEQPESFFDPLPKVMVTLDNNTEQCVFEYYPDEISFTPNEFIGLTLDECRHLKFVKDKKYLTS